MADKKRCVCGKEVVPLKSGDPRKHVCNAPNGPEWAWPDLPPMTGVAVVDVDETDPFVSPNTACTHPAGFTWGDDGIGHSGSVCMMCGAEEDLTGPRVPEENWNGTAPEDIDSPTEELLAAIDDQPHPAENWNGTGRPRPSASTVKMPEPTPQEDKPRLLDTLAAAQAEVHAEVPVPVQQRAAAGLMSLAGQVVSAAGEAASIGAQQMADSFSMPTPQGSGPVRGSVRATAATESRPDTADPFSTPTPSVVLGSATDQPDTWRNSYGQYVIKDPRTGDYKRNRKGKPQGFTRATTFAKTLIDQFGIHQWELRTVLVGLASRPDLVRKAQGLDVTEDRDALQDIIAAAKDAAGGNAAASDGTEFHTVTEWIDAGRMAPADAPEKFRPEAMAYVEEMHAAGLTTKPEWIERVLFTDRVGEDVAGTTDRILLERNGQHVIGDVKSGKGVDLGQREIAMQLKHYAMAVNQFGLYVKTSPPPRPGTDDPAQTGHWEPWTGPPVSEEYGIVMHVPLIRPKGTPAYCDIYRIDLTGVAPYEVQGAHRGAAWVRGWRKAKGFLSPYHAPAAVEYRVESVTMTPEPAPRQRTWAEAFGSVTTPEEANRLWQAAVNAGMGDVDLASNVALARRALQSHG